MGKISTKRRYRRLVLLFFILTLLWMGLIFWFSANDGSDSSAMSGKLLRRLLSVFVPGWDGKTPKEQRRIMQNLHLIFRKCGHFSEYLVLGVFLSVTAALLVPLLPKRIRSRQAKHPVFGILVPAFLAFLYACSDEYHQRFVAGRSGEFRDVMIDFSGACIGILLMLPVCRNIRRRQEARRRAAIEKRSRHRKKHPVSAGNRMHEP